MAEDAVEIPMEELHEDAQKLMDATRCDQSFCGDSLKQTYFQIAYMNIKLYSYLTKLL